MAKAVHFSDMQVDLYDTLVAQGMVSMGFNEFVRAAFHEKFDSIYFKKKGDDNNDFNDS
ncbi:hypothetical protein ISS04_03260 [Candidatus Woesearchaeota archaeon]|nr:hypothetical protein [Candidatus Woesearchaeota archaeon]